MMQWKKDPSKKYTDLCIYIDENRAKLKNPGEYPDIENTVYNYLWLLVKALAIKRRMFTNFQDYDPYSFYAANRLFFALRKNLQNEGKIIKGKQIRPIKSCLNYTKALLYPMKIEYQRESFREIISEEFVSKKFDSFSFKEHLRDEVRANQGVNEQFLINIQDTFKNCSALIDKVLLKSPFSKSSTEYKKLKISIILNCLNILKTKGKFTDNIQTIILWKLPKSMSNYVKILLKEFFTELKKDIMDCYNEVDVDNDTLDCILSNPEWETTNSNENKY